MFLYRIYAGKYLGWSSNTNYTFLPGRAGVRDYYNFPMLLRLSLSGLWWSLELNQANKKKQKLNIQSKIFCFKRADSANTQLTSIYEMRWMINKKKKKIYIVRMATRRCVYAAGEGERILVGDAVWFDLRILRHRSLLDWWCGSVSEMNIWLCCDLMSVSNFRICVQCERTLRCVSATRVTGKYRPFQMSMVNGWRWIQKCEWCVKVILHDDC